MLKPYLLSGNAARRSALPTTRVGAPCTIRLERITRSGAIDLDIHASQ